MGTFPGDMKNRPAPKKVSGPAMAHSGGKFEKMVAKHHLKQMGAEHDATMLQQSGQTGPDGQLVAFK